MYSDIGMAWRTLARQPAFAVLAVATFALGAAANAVVLALAYGVLFKPLPFQEPDRLVAVWPDRFWSNADLLYLRERATVFSDLAAVAPGWTMSMTGVGDPLKVTISRVSPNLFSALGARPRLGRTERGHPRLRDDQVEQRFGVQHDHAARRRLVGRKGAVVDPILQESGGLADRLVGVLALEVGERHALLLCQAASASLAGLASRVAASGWVSARSAR